MTTGSMWQAAMRHPLGRAALDQCHVDYSLLAGMSREERLVEIERQVSQHLAAAYEVVRLAREDNDAS